MRKNKVVRKSKVTVTKTKRLGSAGLGASLFLIGHPVMANGAASFGANFLSGGANNFQAAQHHAVAGALSNHLLMQTLSHQNDAGVSTAFLHKTLGQGQPIHNQASFNYIHSHNNAAGRANAADVSWLKSFNAAAVQMPSVQQFSLNGADLDLRSTATNILLGSRLFSGKSSATIDIGGTPQTFHAGQKVTAAEYIAITEVLNSGSQTLAVDDKGVAVGGSFNINNQILARAAEIVIPSGVTALDNMASSSTLTLSGDLLNYGSLYAYSSNSSVVAGQISAGEIVNQTGGVISTQNGSGQSSNLALTLEASRGLTNSGTISSGGDLSLVSGNGQFANSGLIQSGNGNINLAASHTGTNIVISGGGTFQALNGNINIGDAASVLAGNVTLTGGNYLSQNLNIDSSFGQINGIVGAVSGQLNTRALGEHLKTRTSNLILGSNTINGDPTFVNDGDITISGVNTFTEDVSIIANGSIYSADAAQIVAHGQNVILLAGVDPGAGAPATGAIKTGATGITGTTTIDFNSATNKGGDINFAVGAAGTPIDTSNFNGIGGNVTLAAFANGAVGGNVRFDGASKINTSTSPIVSSNGLGGNVNIIAGGQGGAVQTVNIGNVTTSGGGLIFGGGTPGIGGAVNIITAQPTASSGSTLTFNANGAIAGGAAIVASNTVIAGAAVNVSGTINTGVAATTPATTIKGGDINIQAGSITTGALLANGSSGTTGGPTGIAAGFAGGDGGKITLSAATIAVNGDINASGGNGGNGGNSNFNQAFPGGKGGNAGTIALTSGLNMTTQAIVDKGGIGGNAASEGPGFGPPLAGPAGGSGGNGGTVLIVTNGGNSSLGAIDTSGGSGGTGGGGSATAGIGSLPSVGGAGGNGGSGGNISLQNNLLSTLGLASLTSTGGGGGAGGNGGQGGPQSDTVSYAGATGGAGGAGGTGGAITSTLNGPNTFIIYSTNGGAGGVGGSGGNGFVPSGFGVAAAAGDGGAGGDGGTAGSIMQTAGSFNGAFSVSGGVGALGGTPGATGMPIGQSGATGTSGTKGDITLFGSGAVNAALSANNIDIENAPGATGAITVNASQTADTSLKIINSVDAVSANGRSLTSPAITVEAASGGFSLNFFAPTAGGLIDTTLSAPGDITVKLFNGSINALQIQNGGDLDLTVRGLSVASGNSIMSGTVTIAGVPGFDLNLVNMGVLQATSGNLNISGASGTNVSVNNNGTISAFGGNINITATATDVKNPVGLQILGNGFLSVGSGTITLSSTTANAADAVGATNKVQLSGSQTFNGITVINAVGPNGEVLVDGGNVEGEASLTLNTSRLLVLNGSSISGEPLILNSGTGGGVIASNSSNFDLSTFGGLQFTGSDLVILSSGSITDNGIAVNIDTSNKNGAGGSVSILAGFDFTPAAGTPPIFDTTTAYMLGSSFSPGFTDGNVNLGHTSINTSGSTFGGAVSVYVPGSVSIGSDGHGHSFASAHGNITLGTITTSGGTQAGNVQVLGPNITVNGTITASSANGAGGAVSLQSAALNALITPIFVQGGIIGGGQFTANVTAGTVLTHSINVDGGAAGGSINLLVGSAEAFDVGSTAKSNLNGVVGTLSALGPDGSLTVSNNLGGINNSAPLNNFQHITEQASSATLALGSSFVKNTQLKTINLTVAAGKITESGTLAAQKITLANTGGDIGTASVGFAINTPSVVADASGLVNLKATSPQIDLDATAGTSIKLLATGSITTSGFNTYGTNLTIQAGGKAGSVAFGGSLLQFGGVASKAVVTAAGTGSITSSNPGAAVGGSTLKLTAKSGTIGTVGAPLIVVASDLTETTTGLTNIQDSSLSPLTFHGSNTTSSFVLNAPSTTVTIVKAIGSAASIEVKANTIDMQAAIGGKKTSTVTLESPGFIVASKAGAANATGLITLDGGMVGASGATNALKVNASQLMVTSIGAVNLAETSTKASEVLASTAGGDFILTAKNTTTLDGITAAGNINVLVGTGQLIGSNNSQFVTTNGGITLEESATSGRIILNGSTLSTLATSPGDGAVVLSIGPLPQSVAEGVAPANVTVNNIGAGSVLFGKGLTVGGTTVVNLKGADVTFNVGKAQTTAIDLEGDVTITADPVVPADYQPKAAASSALTANQAILENSGNYANSRGSLISTTGKEPSMAVPAVAQMATSQAPSTLNISAIGQSNLASRMPALTYDLGWMSDTELSNGEIPATIVSDTNLDISSDSTQIVDIEEMENRDFATVNKVTANMETALLVGEVGRTATHTYNLKRGTVLFAPSIETNLKTPYGNVKIAPGSLVLVMAFNRGVAIYNILDAHKGDVMITASGKVFTPMPGAVAVITTTSVKDFAEINPAQMISYANLQERDIDGLLKVYAGNFSLPQALSAVQPLRRLAVTQGGESSQLRNKLLKTSAILAQTSQGQFRRMMKPLKTASLN